MAHGCYRPKLKAKLEIMLTQSPTRLWAEELTACGLPVGEVLAKPDILAHLQINKGGLVAHFADPLGNWRSSNLLLSGIQLNV